MSGSESQLGGTTGVNTSGLTASIDAQTRLIELAATLVEKTDVGADRIADRKSVV